MTSLPTHTERLLIIGALHVDDIATSCSTLVPQASNPVTWQQSIGGVAANAAFSAREVASEATHIVFCAATGSDAVADQLEAAIGRAGLASSLQRIPGSNTGRYTAVMDHAGELHIGLSDVALAEKLDPLRVPLRDPRATAENLNKATGMSTNKTTDKTTNKTADKTADKAPCRALLLDANLSDHCLASLCEQATSSGIQVAAMSVSPVKSRRLLAIAPSIDLLFINRREAIALIDPALPVDVNLDSLADGLTALGFSCFVLTDALDPVLVQESSQRHYIPVPAVGTRLSVNGAGDALAGASFAAWCEGMALADAVRDVGLKQSARIVSGEKRPLPLYD